MGHARGIGGIAWIGGQRRFADHPAEPCVLGIVAHRQHEIAIGRRHHLVGHDVRMCGALAAGHHAADQVVRGLVGQPRHLGVEQGQVDVLAHSRTLGVAQCGQDRGGRVHPGHQVGRGHAHLLRSGAGRAIGLAGHAHQPADGLDRRVVTGALRIRAVLAVAGDRAVHQLRVDRLHAGVVQAVFGQPADLVVLHQHVAARHQLADQRLALRRGEVDRHRMLAAVGAQVIGRLGGVVAVGIAQVGWPPAAGVVAGAGALDLDHLRTEVGQHLGRPRPGQDP